jgi:hypothetical protein
MTDEGPHDEPKPFEAGTEKQPPSPLAAPQGGKRRRRRKKRRADQLDLAALLSEPLHVLMDGKMSKMDPLETSIRAQVRKALVEKNTQAIKAVIDLAIEHDLVQKSPQTQRHGVIRVPTAIVLDLWMRIFRDDEFGPDEILAIVSKHYEQSEE